MHSKFLTMQIKLHKIKSKGTDDMAQTNVNIRMDEDLKKQFDAFCSDIWNEHDYSLLCFCKNSGWRKKNTF